MTKTIGKTLYYYDVIDGIEILALTKKLLEQSIKSFLAIRDYNITDTLENGRFA